MVPALSSAVTTAFASRNLVGLVEPLAPFSRTQSRDSLTFVAVISTPLLNLTPFFSLMVQVLLPSLGVADSASCGMAFTLSSKRNSVWPMPKRLTFQAVLVWRVGSIRPSEYIWQPKFSTLTAPLPPSFGASFLSPPPQPASRPQVTRPATNNAADFLDNFFIEFLPFQVRY